jgi:hypothetical protein
LDFCVAPISAARAIDMLIVIREREKMLIIAIFLASLIWIFYRRIRGISMTRNQISTGLK